MTGIFGNRSSGPIFQVEDLVVAVSCESLSFLGELYTPPKDQHQDETTAAGSPVGNSQFLPLIASKQEWTVLKIACLKSCSRLAGVTHWSLFKTEALVP